jgi:hypothetical protein
MAECVVNDVLTSEEAVKNDARCICLALDGDIVDGLQRLQEILGFPIDEMVSEALRPFVDTFLPIADLYEQGRLSADCVPEVMAGLESFITRGDISKARLDRKVKNLGKQQRMKGGVSDERKSQSPG